MTTTMVETFDAQMLDYQNDDYSMHVSTSDTWFHDEAIMEDDGLPTDDANVSIEVDMEPYDEDHNTEYEMADGSEHYDPDSTELLDVEVYDASRAATPTPILGVDTPILPSSDVADDSHFAHEFIEPLVPDHSPLPLPIELPETSVTNDNPLGSDTAVSSTPSPYPRPAEELTDVSVTDSSSVLAERAPSPSNTELNNDYTVTTRPLEATSVVTEQIDPQGLAGSGERDPLIDDQGDEFNDFAQPEYQNQLGAHEGISASTTHQSGFRDDVEEVEEHADYESSAVSSGDPHEISEGVFIDPPPAVLISFALADRPETSLFNVPSRPQVTDPTASEHQLDIPVLLAHHPILYYEPLSSVFEALRQDEHLANIPEFMNAELALNAYDLEMVLSEDNIDAREVSLHDLNVLHDGLNNSGPLRLRLETAGPRFIVQYRMLREHVTQLSISEANDHDLESLGENSEVKQVHIQQNTEERTEGLEEDEQHSVTNESIDQKPQEVAHDKTPQETAVETHQEVVSTTHEQEEQDSSYVEELEHRQEDVGARELDHEDTLEHKNESLEEPTDKVDHEADYTNPHGEDAGHEEKTEFYIHDGNGEASVDQNSASPSEGLPRDALHATEEVNGDSASASNRTPRPSEIHLPLSNAAGNDKQQEEHSDSHLGADGFLKESDSSLTNLESFPDIDVSEFDLHPEQDTTENENQTNLTTKENLSVTGTLDHESAEYEPEAWDDDLDGEGEPDTLWEHEQEHEQETASNQSSITLSSNTSSKRSISQAELEEDHEDLGSPPHSPGPKRPRVQ